MNVLVTGASGVIGRATIQTLRDRPTKTNMLRLGRSPGNEVLIDLARPGLDVTSVCPVRPEIIVHLAAAVPGPRVADDKENAQRTHYMDVNILNACRVWRCPVIYASGCSIYARRADRPLVESDPLEPVLISPYLSAKRDGDSMFSEYPQGIVLRISAPSGPGLPLTSVMARFSHSAQSDKVIRLWGSGKREQDYVDVRDIALLVVRIIGAPKPGIFNVVAGRPVTMLELAQCIARQVKGAEILIEERPDPNEQILARYDGSRCHAVYGWKSQIGLDDSVRELLRVGP
jgi:nucleoside-diphosphate-sugar epimerase